MSIRAEVKEQITHYIHDPEYLAERTKWRGLIRTFNSAVKSLTSQPKKRRKPRGNTGSPAATEEREGPSS